jgi:Glyoxalase-like domain
VSLQIDHVAYAVEDLDAAGEAFLRDHGLVSAPDGVHPGWGTANRIIALGSRRYLELIAAIDHGTAAASPFGRTVLDRAQRGGGWLALSLADIDIDDTATRLHLTVSDGCRILPDGRPLRWRSAGVDDPRRTAGLPFFIRWEVPPGLHPGDDPPTHPSGADGVAWVEVAEDRDAFRDWTGGDDLPIRFGTGSPGIRCVALTSPDGPIEIR